MTRLDRFGYCNKCHFVTIRPFLFNRHTLGRAKNSILFNNDFLNRREKKISLERVEIIKNN